MNLLSAATSSVASKHLRISVLKRFIPIVLSMINPTIDDLSAAFVAPASCARTLPCSPHPQVNHVHKILIHLIVLYLLLGWCRVLCVSTPVRQPHCGARHARATRAPAPPQPARRARHTRQSAAAQAKALGAMIRQLRYGARLPAPFSILYFGPVSLFGLIYLLPGTREATSNATLVPS